MRPISASLPEALQAARAEIAGLIEQHKATKQQRHDARRAELAAVQERASRRIKRARQAAGAMGLYWGSYNDIVQRADAGRKHGGELHFRRYSGEGTLTAQIIGGAPVAACVGGDHSFFQVQPRAPGQKWRYASMRIGSNADRSPVWLSIPIVYHRDIPDAAHIKSVSITRRVVAGKLRWRLNVTTSLPRPEAKPSGREIGVDIGWRLLPTGVRTAYWHDDAGGHGEVVVSVDTRVRSLRSQCDRNRDEFLPSLAAFLSTRELPGEWQQRTAHLIQWRSTDRLAALVRWWADNRLPEDEEMFAAAVAWRKQYLHLANWWRNLQEQTTLRVREQYRIAAAQIASRYSTVYIEDFDLREVIRSDDDMVGTYRHAVAPGEFRSVLMSTCAREGVRVVKVDAARTTTQCHVCGSIEQWDQRELLHRCQCGALWDQDHNAAINILARGQVARTGNESDGGDFMGPSLDRSQEVGETVAV